MLNIPENVPKDLVEELEACQKQLRILIGNFQVLKERQTANPEDEVIPGQIKQIEKYIIQFNSKQMPIIKKIREIIKGQQQENGLNSSKSSDDDSSVKNEDEKPMSEEEILESLGLKNVARTPEGKIDHGKLSMKDRMAIVRGMRKKRKKGALNGLAPPPSKKPDNGLSDDKEQPEEGNKDIDALANDGQYNGFVVDNEKFEAKPPICDSSECNEVQKRRVETNLHDCDQPQFLANLNLFTPKEAVNILDVISEVSQKKLNYRNMTYIPEMSDKKHKISYTYLAPDINSPPLLRTRQRRQVSSNNSNTASRMNSRSNSRATTPDRSITRQLSSSNESCESSLAGKRPVSAEKVALENELSDLMKRSDELQSILGANKRTISTRKERSRLSEYSEEATQLDTRILQLRKTLAKF